MLVDFEVANFRSFRDSARMTLESIPAYKERTENVFSASRFHLLKEIALYGPNAGGKSNFVRAIAFATNFVKTSATRSVGATPIPVIPFKLDTETEGAPSRFQFTLLDESVRYRYGFCVDEATVHSEWLYMTDLAKVRARETVLFLREGSGIDARSSITDAKALISRTRDDALFLSVAAQWNEPLASRVISLIKQIRVLFGLQDARYQFYSAQMAQTSGTTSSKLLLDACRNADLGIENIRVEERELAAEAFASLPLPADVQANATSASDSRWIEQHVYLEHPKYSHGKVIGSVAFDLEKDASAGTQKYFRMMGPIIDTLENGYTMIVDELEAKLHPLLTRRVVHLFQSQQTNPKNAQLIFCTHDTSLLASAGLRRDQIWFVEKSPEGASSLYPLSDFKGVRQDSSIASDYIKGRFGAIPFVGGENVLADLSKGT
jgi:energy-coupling factor transporter ATP-binding protein EcfA2